MAILPTDIPTGLVTGQFYFVNEDNVDANTDPELTVVQGNVTFTCSAPLLRMPTKLATVIPLTFKGAFDSNGNLVSASDPTVGLKLPATDSVLFNPTGFTWRVSFSLTQAFNGYTIQVAPFDIQVPAGGTVDLTTAMPVSTSPGTITVQGPPGSGSDAFIAAQVQNTGSATRGALGAAYVRFVDLAGNPISARHVTVKVDTSTWEIADIVAEV